MGMRGSGLAAAAGVALLAAACRSPRPRLLEVEPGGAGAVKVVVAPLNLALKLSPDLEDATEPVSWEIIRYFQSHAARVAVIWAPDAWSLWRDVAASVRKSDTRAGLEQIGGAFSRRLAEHADFDLLAMPALVYREARVTGRHALWDGVRRRIRFHFRSAVPRGTDPSPGGVVQFRLETSGLIVGLSLHVLVFTPEGRRVFEGFGGLDLVHDVVQEREGGPDPPFLRLQAKPLGNAEHVREGIAVALDPYVVPRPR
jgi:hypothetical protein